MRIRAVESLGVLQLPEAATVLQQALADRNSGVRKVGYGGHGARLVQGLRVRGARYRTILTIGTVAVAALLIRAHLVRTGTLGPPE